MLPLHSSVGRVRRLLISATLISCAAISGAQAQLDPPRLANLVIISGTGPIGFVAAPLSPSFDPETFEYNITIPFEHSEVEVALAEPIDPLHFRAEPIIPTLLPGQSTPFAITVDEGLFGPASTTYTINVTRGASNNVAVLSNLASSGSSLSPAFNQLTFEYAGSVPNDMTSITITPTAQAATSTITVNDAPATSGIPFGPISLAEVSTEIIIRVMDQDETGEDVTKAYILDITRLPPSADSDSDGDGMEDGFESVNGLNVGLNDADLDLDGDGLSNLGEYAFGSNPNDFSDTNAPVVTRNAQGFLVITFNRAIEPSDGTYEVQVSSTLDAWSSAEVVEEGNSTPSLQIWRDSFGGASTPPPVRFIRVVFTSAL